MNLKIINASIRGNLDLFTQASLLYACYNHHGWDLIGRSGQIKLPQQVALTEFKGQVSAKVEVIIVTYNNPS